jgi:hypothetical protein
MTPLTSVTRLFVNANTVETNSASSTKPSAYFFNTVTVESKIPPDCIRSRNFHHHSRSALPSRRESHFKPLKLKEIDRPPRHH